jgi:protein tyrosine/serine phosphatase
VSPRLWLANFREVASGRFYRSGQLDADELRQVVQRFGIRTIVNLRGYDPRPAWRAGELAVARELGVAHFDVHLSARSLPRPEEIAKLLAIYRESTEPILVHCDSGADRAGEAAALYRIEVLGEPSEAAAARELSLTRRHWSWRKPEKLAFLAAWRGSDWLRSDYDPCSGAWRELRRPRSCEAEASREAGIGR